MPFLGGGYVYLKLPGGGFAVFGPSGGSLTLPVPFFGGDEYLKFAGGGLATLGGGLF